MNARELLQRVSGLDLSEQVVERALRERMAHCGVTDSAAYLQQLSPAELAALIELVVVPESWMFRDSGAFSAATAFVQQQLAAQPGRIVRILSVPCAGGEEPYSMAMALCDAGVAAGACRIEAADLSKVAVERARAGRYTRNAFRGVDLAFRERYFSRRGDEYQISDELRAQVTFSQANLLAFDSASAAGRYDVVFCRNLLIYFDDPTTTAAIAVLSTLLADDGMLFAGYAEVPAFCRNGFAPLRLPGAFALQKAGATPAAKPRAAAARPPARKPAPATSAAKAAPAVAPLALDCASLLAAARRQADRGHYQEATASTHALLAADPNSADAYFLLGVISECQHNSGAADDYWRRCVYLQPDHYDALCHLALLAEQTGDAAQAGVFRQRATRVFERRAGHSR
ncbi:methyltransferase [Massilia eurypsychrophila]|jgi:chemotaxis protein methyltransferase WspC|uniref:Methyltransferase n=1 Tax=Massilia eurypsychrophila TaxID=1485217 RepID=A0A2G8TF76_9BURK|nr:protein-glutamate O-methyltransferase CheR [Massilia eurypsychrophila]PIL44692.1 methyltransferase [Massilia eurypsychrophila]